MVLAGDMQGIDRVLQRVKAMYEPIESVSFNIFDYGKDDLPMYILYEAQIRILT